ncbi:MAG: hypothetical protein WCV56_04535 [Candidatus Omnitrophota bacterium]
MRKSLTIFGVVFIFVFSMSCCLYGIEEMVPGQRPDPEGIPTEVRIAAYLTDLSGVDSVGQSFTPTFIVMVRWHDPRLATETTDAKSQIRKRPIDEVWHPELIILNQKRLFKFFNPKDLVEITSDGNVSYVEQYFGELVFPMDLRMFPFDSHSLPITLISGKYGPDEVHFEIDKERTGRNDVFSVADWEIDQVKGDTGEYRIGAQARDLSRVDFTLKAKRYSGFYMSRVVMPLVFIVLMSFSVFWIDPRELGTQLTVATTSILTLIAFQFAMNSSLPRIFYLTKMDVFILGATVIVFAAFIEAVITSFLAKRNNQELALAVDRKARLIFPGIFLVLIAYYFFM